MKITTYFIILFLALFSCKKDEVSNPPVNSPFTVRYEVTTTCPYVPTTPGHSEVYIMYATYPATNIELEEDWVKLETSWSKTLTITSANRPIVLSLSIGPGTLVSSGTMTSSIYLNGTKVKTATATKTADNIFVGLPQIMYMVY